MRIFAHHEGNDELAYASVQMRRDEYMAMRAFFNADEQDGPDRIRLPFGARLVKQGFGWYRLLNYRTVKGALKIKTAMKYIRLFYKRFQESVNAELRVLLQKAVHPNSQLVAYNSPVENIPGQGYVMVTKHQNKWSPKPVEVRPPSDSQISQLLSRFGRPQQKTA